MGSVSVWHALDRGGKGPVTEAEDGLKLRQSFPTGGGYGLGCVPPSSPIVLMHCPYVFASSAPMTAFQWIILYTDLTQRRDAC